MASDVTQVRVTWGPVPAASGFRISWRTDSGQCRVCGRVAEGTDQGMGDRGSRRDSCQHFPLTLGPESSQTLPPGSTVTDIMGLRPGTSYQVAVSALRGREAGPPAVIVAQTGQGPTQPLGSLPPVPFQTPRPPLSDACFSSESQQPPSDSHCILPWGPCSLSPVSLASS